ncbi:unnamed protein product [Prunus armeniaca]
MKLNDKKDFLKFVSSVKFPDGYATNIARCVNVDGGKFIGLKSHDCHVFMPRLLPVGIRHLLPEDVVKPIMLLSRFFSELTAKTLRKIDINQLRYDIVQVLCKFEMIFPPAFFTSMIHVMVHLLEEALLAGPASRIVEKNCTQQGEARRINYRGLDVDMAFNHPQRNKDRGLRNEKLSVFAQSVRPFGDPVRGELFSENDMEIAHWFVLNNCDEIMAYLDKHEEMMKREHPSHLYAKKHRDLFPQWFLEYRNVYAIPELDPKADFDNVTDQQLESSMETNAKTLRDTNVIQEPFQLQGVSSIEIPWARTTKVMRMRIGRPKVMIGKITTATFRPHILSLAETASLSAVTSAHYSVGKRTGPPQPLKPRRSPTVTVEGFWNLNPKFWLVFEFKIRPLPAIFRAIVIALDTHALLACGRLWQWGIGSQSNPLFVTSMYDMFRPLDRTQTHMSDLIRCCRAVTTTPSSEPSAQPASAATAPALMDQVPVGLGGSQAPASSASLVVQPVSARRRHRPANTTDTTSTDSTGASGSQPVKFVIYLTLMSYFFATKKNTRGPCRQLKTAKVTRVTNSRISIGYDARHQAAPTSELHSSSAHDIGHVVRTHCPMQWKSWKVMPDEIKMEVRGQLSMNYNLEDLDEELLAYVNRRFSERYKQWKSNLHHHFEAFDDPQVALHDGCPKELEGREDSWAWLCAHFQAPNYVNKAQVNKGNRKKKTLLHHSSSRPFSYRMDALRRGGSKFSEIDVFGDVYVRPGNELAESLNTTMVERSQFVLQESASQLPPETPIESVDPPQDAGFQILTDTLDQTLGKRPRTYCRGMGNARQREPRPRSSSQANSQVIVLSSRVGELEGQMSVILQSLARSGIPIPNFGALTSEHPHQTTAPIDPQISEPHMPDDHIDFGTLFD